MCNVNTDNVSVRQYRQVAKAISPASGILLFTTGCVPGYTKIKGPLWRTMEIFFRRTNLPYNSAYTRHKPMKKHNSKR